MVLKRPICPCGKGYDDDGDGNCSVCAPRKIAELTLTTSIKNLETAKLAHKNMSEQLSMRTATVAQMAAVLISGSRWPVVASETKWGAAAAVKIAEELMAEAEASAAKAKELQEIKDSK